MESEHAFSTKWGEELPRPPRRQQECTFDLRAATVSDSPENRQKTRTALADSAVVASEYCQPPQPRATVCG